MQTDQPIKVLLFDIGGVLLTNGWGTSSRKAAAEKFFIDFTEMNDRHKIAFDAYETGKMSLDEYLQLIVFYEKRDFTNEQFREFMFAQSQPFQPMLDWVKKIKQQYQLRVAAVNNEGRELNDYRISAFGLEQIFDVFVSSSYVHLRKPDKDIYKLAMDILIVKPEDAVYVDDRQIFVEVAQRLGIRSVRHTDIETTQASFKVFGLEVQ